MPSYMKTTKTTLRAIQERTLTVTDKIIDLSLRRKGTRPPPGVRKHWRKGLREKLWEKQNHRCMYCGIEIELRPYESQIDHLVPIARSGGNEEENFQLTCSKCNNRKGDRTDEEFRFRLRSLLSSTRGHIPNQIISQDKFQAAMAKSPDPETYIRWKAGKYLTAGQKIKAGAIATGVGIFSVAFFPIYFSIPQEDASILLLSSGGLGLASTGWVWIRAKLTGKDQE